MLHTTLRNLSAHKRRVASTSLAVILGVAFLVATLVLGTTLESGFGASFRALDAGTDVVVRNPTVIGSDALTTRGTLDASLVDQVRSLPGVASAAGTVSGIAQIVGADGVALGGQGPPTTGAAWISDRDLNARRIIDGRPPRRPGEVIIDARSARDGHLAVGTRTTVRTPTPVPVTVVGIARLEPVDHLGATFVGFTRFQAVGLFGRQGQVDSIVVHSDGSRSSARLRDEIARAVGGHTEAVTGAQLLIEQEQAIDAGVLTFANGLLRTFAVVALVVAGFSIQNTFSIVMAQRTRASALLRALGATRRQVLGSLVAEAAITGLLASLVGVAIGIGLGAGLRSLFAVLGLDVAGALVVSGASILVGVAVGVVLSLVASLWPAVRAARVPPVAALRDLAVEPGPPSRLRAGAGIVLVLSGVALCVVAGGGTGSVAQAGVGSLAVVVAAVLLGPHVARPAARFIGGLVAVVRGQPGRLAQRNAVRNPRRTASSGLALVIGTAVVALLATFGASVRASIDQTVRSNFGGDLVVTQNNFSGNAVSDKVAPSVAQLPEVARAVPIAGAIAQVGGREVDPSVADLAKLRGLVDLDVRQGDVARLGPGRIAVSEHYRSQRQLRLGEPLTLRFADGIEKRLTIGAVYRDRALMGDLVMAPADWAPHARRSGVEAVTIGLAPGVDLGRGRAAVEEVTGALGAPSVQDREQYVRSQAGPIDQLLALAYGLLGVAVVIALLGIANTLSLSIHERTRELGLLRAIGLSRAWMRATVRWESVITAVIGTGTGLVVGTFLGWTVIRAFAARQGFIRFHAPVTTLVVVLLAATAAGVVAAARPARRAGRLDILAAIAEA